MKNYFLLFILIRIGLHITFLYRRTVSALNRFIPIVVWYSSYIIFSGCQIIYLQTIPSPVANTNYNFDWKEIAGSWRTGNNLYISFYENGEFVKSRFISHHDSSGYLISSTGYYEVSYDTLIMIDDFSRHVQEREFTRFYDFIIINNPKFENEWPEIKWTRTNTIYKYGLKKKPRIKPIHYTRVIESFPN